MQELSICSCILYLDPPCTSVYPDCPFTAIVFVTGSPLYSFIIVCTCFWTKVNNSELKRGKLETLYIEQSN